MSRSQPLINPYLWAACPAAPQFSASELVADRFEIAASQIWQDTTPDRPLPIPDPLPEAIVTYLRLFPQRLHIPEVYGVCEVEGMQILLLQNVPIDARGRLYPSLQDAWPEASGTRQAYWLWQILQLWIPLAELGVASALLAADNLRVEGWCVRLLELYFDATLESEVASGAIAAKTATLGTAVVQSASVPTLPKLGESWEPLVRSAREEVAPLLAEIASGLQTEGVALKTIANALNEILLAQAAQQPLRMRAAGASDRGRTQERNEDSCYPTQADLALKSNSFADRLSSHFLIVCDGIGGHEGGEVASKLAVQSLKLQVRSLLNEIAEDPETMTPKVVEEQLAAIVRIANNVIAIRNDRQGRESRRRMATTLVMALQLPQQAAKTERDRPGVGNSHELYLVHVGDSRAYWITPHYCQQLTVDDDVATREVRLGRSLYREARQRPDAGALTQALGTRTAELLRPTIQRFILEEDGVLLLCSDGLSDNQVLEESWQETIPKAISGQIALESAIEDLIRTANEKNGRDNISAVAAAYRISPPSPVLVNLSELPEAQRAEVIQFEAPWGDDASEPESAVEEEDAIALETEETKPARQLPEELGWVLKLLLIAIALSVSIFVLRWQINSGRQPEPPSPSPEQTN